MTFCQFIFRNNAILRIANSILDHFYHFANQNGIGALSTMSEFSTQLQKKLSPLCPKTTRGEKGGRGAHFLPLGVKIGILGKNALLGVLGATCAQPVFSSRIIDGFGVLHLHFLTFCTKIMEMPPLSAF